MSGTTRPVERLERRQMLSAAPVDPQQPPRQPPPPPATTVPAQPPSSPTPSPTTTPAPAAAVRSADGSGNNVAHADWGATGQPLIRLAAAAYGDGISTPAGASRPSARAVSNAVVAHPADEIPNASHLSAYAYAWGQFIDHDLDLTNAATPAESFDVAVPTGDPYFDPAGTGTQTIGLTRSQYAAGTGVTSPRQQTNSITAFIDGSMVYGSDSARAAALRSGVGGRLKTSEGGLLPFNTLGLDNATLGGPADTYFVAGDVRANENVELTSVQTLFVREHNRQATRIQREHPAWTDDQVYQQARRIVIGEIQAITYNEFLPALLGQGAVAAYSGYKSNVNPGISNEFSTAAFRFGHSMLQDDVEFIGNDGTAVRDEVPLAGAFFNPALVQETGVDPILKYLASSNAEEIDTKVVDSLRNFLFGPPGSGGLDLATLNIQRGRDHGLADYNSTRAAVGLPRVTRFDQITSDPAVQASLKALYGTVDNIDLWVGGLAETHAAGSNLGPTFTRIIADQFTRTRDGDRFWYQRDLSGSDLQTVQNTHLSDVIRANTQLTTVQPNAFVFDPTIGGVVWNDANGNARRDNNEPGIAGRRVELLDAVGAVVQTTKTDAGGRYEFGDIDLGQYKVRVETPAGWQSTPLKSGLIAVTGGFRIDGIDVAQRRVGPVSPTPTTPPPAAPSTTAAGTGGVNDPLAPKKNDPMSVLDRTLSPPL